MELTTLTQPNLILIAPAETQPLALITRLAEKLAQAGKVTDAPTFIASVLKREAEGPTALGEELAVPHGKSDSVTEAAFALAILSDPIAWNGLDGDEPVKLVFLLAIPPEEAGSTHIQLLTSLTSHLTDDVFREQLLAANTPERVMTLLSSTEEKAEPPPEHPKQSLVIPAVLGIISTTAFVLAALSWGG